MNKYINQFIINSFSTISLHAYEAVVTQPIIDALEQKAPSKNNNISTKNFYYSIPYMWHTDKKECIRAHQLLYNHRVIVIEEDDEQAKIVIPHLIITTLRYSNSSFWILLSGIKKMGPKQEQYIPKTIADSCNEASIVSLTFPWNNPFDKKLYSPGTRFVRSNQDTSKYIGAYWFDNARHKAFHISLPRNKTFISTNKSFSEKQTLMVQLINKWIDEYGTTPYIWGGTSIGVPVYGKFYLETINKMGKKLKGWYWPQHTYPLAGLDCSGLILLAAQTVELPYFYKNSQTIIQYMKPLEKNETIENGDIIWTPGHVIIVSNVEKNELIEAQGYWPSSGHVKRQTLPERFKNIFSYNDLAQLFFNKKPLIRINANGSTKTFKNYSILKFSSAYEFRKN